MLGEEIDKNKYLKKAEELAQLSVKRGSLPNGAVIVEKTLNEIIGKGHNMVSINRNPILHAEIVAISDACHNLNTIDLSNCDIYINSYPCIMCLSAIQFANIKNIYFL